MKKYLKELKPFLNIKCLIWALVCVILLLSYSPQIIFKEESKTVTVTLLEERNPSTMGCEAWVKFPDDIKIITVDEGWSRYNNGYLCVAPNTSLVIELPAGNNIIATGMHQYAGKLSIRWEDNERIIDLYSANAESFDISIKNPWIFDPSFYKILLVLAVFIVALFSVTGIKHFLGLKALPPIIAALLFFYSYPEIGENWLTFAYVLICALSIWFLWKNKFSYLEEYRKSKLLNTLIVILACYTVFAFWGFEFFLDSAFMIFTTENMFMFLSLCIFTVYPFYAIISLYEKFKKKQLLKQTEQPKPTRVRLTSFGLMAVILTVWCLILSPGNMTSDNVDQWLQATDCYPIYNAHPAIHTILIRLTTVFYKSPIVYIILQSVLFAYILSGFFGILYKKGAPKKLLYALSVIIAIAPNTVAMLTCPSKNILFAILICWLTIQLLEMFDDPKAFFKSPLKMLQFVLAIAFNYLIRHNTFVFLPIVIAACIYFTVKLYRSIKLKPVICVTVAILITQLISGPVYNAFDVQRGESSGLPITSLILPFTTAVKYDIPLSEETVEYLEKILPLEEYEKRYSPYNGDIFGWSLPLPDTSDVTTSEAMRHYLNFLSERPDVVIKDRLDGVNLIWDVFSHPDVNHDRYALGIWGPAHLSDYAEQFPDVFVPDRQTSDDVYTIGEGYPKILEDYVQHFNESELLNAIFWRNGIYIILVLLCIVIALKERKYRAIISILPAIAILATLVLVISWQIYQYVYFFPLCTMVISLYLLYDPPKNINYEETIDSINEEVKQEEQ